MKISMARSEGNRIRESLSDLSLKELENIARDEYDVTGIIYTSLAWKQAKVVTRVDHKRFIFYYDYGRLYTPIAFAHEIGHLAIGHHNGYIPNFLVKELEADSFVAGLFDISLFTLNKIRYSEGWKRFKDILKNPNKYNTSNPDEVERLKKMNVYWML